VLEQPDALVGTAGAPAIAAIVTKSSGRTRSTDTAEMACRRSVMADTTAVGKLGASRSKSAVKMPSVAGPMNAASSQPASASASRCGSSESSPGTAKTTRKVCSVVGAAGDIATDLLCVVVDAFGVLVMRGRVLLGTSTALRFRSREYRRVVGRDSRSNKWGVFSMAA
jgi:hypothetical protein